MQPVKPIVLAAGGLLTRTGNGSTLLAIIHRNRYGGDWTLPKGHFEPGNDATIEETALREVREETGCTAGIISFVDVIHYETSSEIKAVFFWRMALRAEANRQSAVDEVQEIQWLTCDKALNIMSYDLEKRLVAEHIMNK